MAVGWFQSSPVPKDGCNQTLLKLTQRVWCVSILTRPEGRVQHLFITRPFPPSAVVSILTRPEGRVQPILLEVILMRDLVSILTRPEGRVQLDALETLIDAILVSILTRPEGRVQRPPSLRGCSG